MTTLLTSARAGRLDAHLDKMLRLARDPRGRAGDGYPSPRTLKRWLSADDLTPRRPQKDMSVPAWAPDFLSLWQVPQKPSVAAAFKTFNSLRPGVSIHQVRRFLDKLGTVTRERGRMGDRELKNIRPYITRSFDDLMPNEVWSADGHTFDAEVQHPFHGRPFKPEITTIVDIATRRIVGWSVALSESATAVLEALRNAAEFAGLCDIFYVDNGSGYDNALLKADGVGLAGRMGFEVRHSLPYNSQARGVIERLHQTVWVAAARMLPSYVGADMDREAKLAQFKITRQALKAAGKTRAMPLLPWAVFMQFTRERVAEYNARPHKSLKGMSPDLKWREKESAGWEAHRLAACDLDALFRPRVMRKLNRGRVDLFTNYYSNNALEEFHGERVQVAYDIHRPEKVWIYTPEGRFIGEAEVNGNTRRYFPVAVSEMAGEQRVAAAEKRVKAKLSAVREELNGPALEAPKANEIVIGGPAVSIEKAVAAGQALAASDARPVPAVARPSRSERPIAEVVDEWQALDARIRAGQPVSEQESFWHGSVQRHPGWKVEMKRRMESGGAEFSPGGSDAGRRAAG